MEKLKKLQIFNNHACFETAQSGNTSMHFGRKLFWGLAGHEVFIISGRVRQNGVPSPENPQIMPVTNPALLAQIHLSGESACVQFRPHPLKANFCTACSKLVNKHSPDAIPDDEHLLAVRGT